MLIFGVCARNIIRISIFKMNNKFRTWVYHIAIKARKGEGFEHYAPGMEKRPRAGNHAVSGDCSISARYLRGHAGVRRGGAGKITAINSIPPRSQGKCMLYILPVRRLEMEQKCFRTTNPFLYF
jgi:hypothetical protein